MENHPPQYWGASGGLEYEAAWALGSTEHVGVFRGLIESRVKLGAWKDQLMRDPLRIPEAYLASAQAQHARGVWAA